MTFLGIILLAIGAVGLGMIAYRKAPAVALIDTDTIAGAKEARLKNDLLWGRVARAFAAAGSRIFEVARPGTIRAVEKIHHTIDHLKRLEEKYVGEHITPRAPSKSEAQAQAAVKLAHGQKLAEDEHWKQAEDCFVDAIKLDRKCVGAYEGLAELYVATRDLEKAEEMYQFLLKLHEKEGKAHAGLGKIAKTRGKLRVAESEYLRALARHKYAENHVDLGVIYLAMGDPDRAVEQFEAALRFEPASPKFLDFLLEASILSGRKTAARKIYDRLAEANPENAKLPEFSRRIEQIAYR